MSHESKDLDSCGIRPTNCMYLVDPTIEMVNIQEFWAKRIHSRDDVNVPEYVKNCRHVNVVKSSTQKKEKFAPF